MSEMYVRKALQMGLGEAIERFNLLHSKKTRGIASQVERDEHVLIMDALNQTKLDLGFDCDEDGIPDTVEIFARTAKTSCCRITPTESPRKKTSSRKPIKKKKPKRG